MNTTTKYRDSFIDKLHRPFGLDAETAPGLWIVLFGLFATALVIFLTHGDIFIAAALIFILGLVMLTIYRLDYSLMVLIGFVLIFDQYHIPGFDPITFKVDYFRNLKEIRYLPFFEAGVMNLIELHFLLLFFIWFLVLAVKRRFSVKRIPVWGTFLLFFGWIIFSFAYGLQNGGDFLISLWELRALFYMAALYLVIPQVIWDKKQLRFLMWLIIVAILIKAFQGVGRFVSLGFSMSGAPTLTNHEDPVFMISLFILLLSFWLYRVKDSQKLVLILMLLPLILGFLVAQRRAAMAALIISLFVFFIFLSGREQWKLFRWGAPVLVVVLIYGAAVWDIEHRISQPVQMIKTGMERPDKEENPRDYYSNLYREFEDYNLAYTLRQNPVLGIGFGTRFEHPLQLAEINYPLREFIPHNQIFWVIVKSGSIGFFLFWFFLNSFAFRTTALCKRLKDPYLKSIGTVVVIAVIAQMVASFFDMQLTFYRNMIFLGVLMGLVPVLEDLDSEQDAEKITTEERQITER